MSLPQRTRDRFLRRFRFASAFLAVSLCAVTGCAPIDFAAHESFDAWYVSQDRSLPAERLGFSSLEGNLAGYLVNDVAIRTPLAFLREGVYLLLTPVALPYFAGRFVLTGLGGDEAPEAGD